MVTDEKIKLCRNGLKRFKEKYYVYSHPKTDWFLLHKGEEWGLENACSDVEGGFLFDE